MPNTTKRKRKCIWMQKEGFTVKIINLYAAGG